MPDCCVYDDEFSPRVAQADLRRYRRRGLDDLERQIVDYLVGAGVEGRSVLEVGGGVGGLHVELLKAGAESVTNVEMSSQYEDAATNLLEEEALSGRVDRQVADFAESGSSVPAADYVIMNRVLCCYPDMPQLLSSALGNARRLLAVTFPRRRRLVSVMWATSNLWRRLKRESFRSYMHSPEEILSRASDRGFAVAFEDQTAVWHTVVFEPAAR